MEKPTSTFETVDEYIASFPPTLQELLQQVRLVVRAAAPEARETISYGMPTYKGRKNLVHFAANKSHLGFYPAPPAIKAFASDLDSYKTSKGAIQFPYAKPIPLDLIRRMVEYRVEEDRKKA